MTLNQIVKYRLDLLKKSNNTLKDVFEIIHKNENDIFCEITDGYKIKYTTYGQCQNYSKIMASFLNERLSCVPKHSFVGLMMENSLEFVTTLFALLMIGYKPLLLNIRLGSNLNQEIIERLNVKYIICDKDYQLNAKFINVANFDYSLYKVDESIIRWEDELAITTSATSLNVKICVYDGSSICEQIKNTNKILKDNKMIKQQYDKAIKQLAFLPFYHIFGLMATYFWFAFFGRRFVFLKDLSSDTILRTIKKHKVTHIFAVPMLWHQVYKAIIKEVEEQDEKTKNKFYKGIKLSNKLQSIFPNLGLKIASSLFKEVRTKVFGESIKFMISGGSYIYKEAIEVMNGIGYPLFNGYGMSEIGITSVELSKYPNKRNLVSIGKPFEKVEYLINEEGVLLVKSLGICKRIITKDQDLLIDRNNYFNTNDYATSEKDGRYYIVGRLDDVVLTPNGEKINPDMIEKILSFSSIERYSILGLSKNNEKQLALVLEVNSNINQLKINKLISELEENLHKLESLNYHLDQVYYTYDKIASITAIKVSRKILNTWIENGNVKLEHISSLKEKKIIDLSDLELKISSDIKKIFGDVLNKAIDEIDLNSHFIFDLGGTSLEYLTLLVKLKERFEVEFNKEDKTCYTVIEFTTYLIEQVK